MKNFYRFFFGNRVGVFILLKVGLTLGNVRDLKVIFEKKNKTKKQPQFNNNFHNFNDILFEIH